MVIKTVFRKDKEGTVYALFPKVENEYGQIKYYTQDGFDFGDTYELVKNTVPAEYEEYEELREELEDLGYKVNIGKRIRLVG